MAQRLLRVGAHDAEEQARVLLDLELRDEEARREDAPAARGRVSAFAETLEAAQLAAWGRGDGPGAWPDTADPAFHEQWRLDEVRRRAGLAGRTGMTARGACWRGTDRRMRLAHAEAAALEGVFVQQERLRRCRQIAGL
mmetsp:Transcript_104256/g.290399  ORF Transcript_104256/g.290399 Transcript_104256/m.290399 type:complete len:139 (-) Transcript_104256:118-534(-)